MKFPQQALEALASIIQGLPIAGTTEPISGKFSIAKISHFFEDFGGDGLFPRADSRDAANYVFSFLGEINDTVDIDRLVCALPGFCASHEYRDDHPNTIAYEINKIIKPHGFCIKKHQSTFSGFSSPSFIIEQIIPQVIPSPNIDSVSPENVRSAAQKARDRLDALDFTGAITVSYTVVESLIKLLLRELKISFNESSGDIKQLYTLIIDPLNINPAGHNLESYQRSILQGLKSLVAGLYDVANKAGDRHDALFVADQRHAKLAVNSAFSLCEFLLDSFDYQQQMSGQKITS